MASPSSPAFSGTMDKCSACGKRVYPMEQLAADARIYHRTCFRCTQCKATLKFSNYSSIEGVLYCKPHYDQLVMKAGSAVEVMVPGGAKTPAKPDRSSTGTKGQSSTKFSSIFTGTRELCVACGKTVYPLEKIALDGSPYHKQCFKCSHGGCILSLSNHVAHDNKLYCKHHHAQLLLVAGNFRKLEEADVTTKVAVGSRKLEEADVAEKVMAENPSAAEIPSPPADQTQVAEEKPLQTAVAAEPVQDNVVEEPVRQNSETETPIRVASRPELRGTLPFEMPKLRPVGSRKIKASTSEETSKATQLDIVEKPKQVEPASQNLVKNDAEKMQKPLEAETSIDRLPPGEEANIEKPPDEELITKEVTDDKQTVLDSGAGGAESSAEPAAAAEDEKALSEQNTEST